MQTITTIGLDINRTISDTPTFRRHPTGARASLPTPEVLADVK
jgi:hypothetical protein